MLHVLLCFVHFKGDLLEVNITLMPLFLSENCLVFCSFFDRFRKC